MRFGTQAWGYHDMIITICGSLKFYDEMKTLQKQLEGFGHTVHLPMYVAGIDYWSTDGVPKVQAKKLQDLMKKHMELIRQSDAILIANYTKGDAVNYIGGNTYLEMGIAHFFEKPIYLLNPAPDQPYINDELQSMDLTILNGNLKLFDVST